MYFKLEKSYSYDVIYFLHPKFGSGKAQPQHRTLKCEFLSEVNVCRQTHLPRSVQLSTAKPVFSSAGGKKILGREDSPGPALSATDPATTTPWPDADVKLHLPLLLWCPCVPYCQKDSHAWHLGKWSS